MNLTNEQTNNASSPDPTKGVPQATQLAGAPEAPQKPYVPEKDKEKDQSDRKQNMGMIGLLVIILTVAGVLLFTNKRPTTRAGGTNKASTNQQHNDPQATSPGTTGLPLSAPTGEAHKTESNGDFVSASSIANLAQKKQTPKSSGTLGDIPTFDKTQPWAYPTTSPGAASSSPSGTAAPAVNSNELPETRTEREALEKPSLVFVKGKSSSLSPGQADASAETEIGVGLVPGTKLRARLESALNTAVTMPVVAVIEYDYEQQGEIVVPAGSKAFGRLEGADRSGFVSVHFDSLMYPSGETVKFEALATDLQLRPLRGKVEGKNTGKNILVRTVSGLGEIASAVLGGNSVNQPLSEADLLRARVGENIGQSADQELAKLAVTEHIVVSVPANTPVYVVVEKPAKPGASSTVRSEAVPTARRSTSAAELRQLLQLQRELNDSAKPVDAAQVNPNPQ